MEKSIIKLGYTLLFSAVCSSMFAQAGLVSEPVTPSLWEQIALLDKVLIGIALGLLVPIYYLSKIFNWSLKHYLQKRLDKNHMSSIVIIGLLVLPSILSAQMNGDLSFDSFNFLRWFLLTTIGIEVFILGFFGYQLFKQFAAYENPEGEVESKQNWLVKWWNESNNFGSLEDEKNIDTGHNYDGIQELDNNIPIWFTATFVACIIFAFIYMWQYHIAEISPLQAEEYQIEVEEAAIAHQQYLKTVKSTVDESNLSYLTSESAIEEGKSLYMTNCATCHVADGGGNQGPNLADASWIYGCSPLDVYKSIKYGRKNGMMAWKDNFNDERILKIASFVKTLEGTSPANPKEAQGEICKIENESSTTADSTSN